MHAADRGARVINVSTVTCLPADRGIDQAELGRPSATRRSTKTR
ncbi:subtilase domain protein [Mycobacterium xenopi 3993]|nr:subtilase domain protein [Mycobacterium xenopi 3993]